MSGKALVVDDSTSARAVLAQQLRDQQIEVDAVDSGEAALRYLEEQHPDVIFMDHLLPGMDGFEALQAIKENPETCNIPVLMYTSKRGEVYLNQVRELGAAGVLPKGNKPIQVSKVLRSLRLASPHGTAGNPDNGNVEAGDGSGNPDLVLQDMYEGLPRLKARLGESQDLDEVDERFSIRGPRAWDMWRWAVVALAIICIGLAYQFSKSQDLVAMLKSQAQVQERALRSMRDGMARDLSQISRALAGGEIEPLLATAAVVDLEALEWALNLDQWVDPGDRPLGDVRLATVEGLLKRLDRLGFEGVVTLHVHSGVFCQNRKLGRWIVAGPGQIVSQCGYLGTMQADEQSRAFSTFLSSSPILVAGRIRLEIIAHGDSIPLMAYPVDAASISANTWNGIAALNNRVETRLLQTNQAQ
ncbi:MAG: response regulator [Gammaproteobacteria bacterium]|nr:response regulator [Gammaproteobacteria bacterium]